jgi:predicted alpha/beta hydrolase family esterase
MTTPNHPAVDEWLARLDTEASALPAERRAELRTSIDDA